MGRVILKRDFDFFLSKVSVIVDKKVITMGLSDMKSIDIPEGENTLFLSAMGFFSSQMTLLLKDGDLIIIRPFLPKWYYLVFLSLICLLFVLGMLSILPPIWGSSTLILFLFPILYVTFFKHKEYFKVIVFNGTDTKT